MVALHLLWVASSALTAHGSVRVLSETVAGVTICFQLHYDSMQVGVRSAALVNCRSECREEPEGKGRRQNLEAKAATWI